MVSTRLASKRPVEAHEYTGLLLRLPDEPLRCACVRMLELICSRVAAPSGSANTVNVNPMITSLPRVVVDATVSSDEPLDTSLVHLVQRLQPRPRGERDPLRHRRIRREDNLARVLPHDRAQLVDDLGACAVVLDHD